MRRMLALACFALVACSQSQPIAGRTPGATPSTGSARPSATPTQAADLPVSPLDFSCRLPVVIDTPGSEGVVYHGGFLTFPGAQLTPDPAGLMQYRSAESDFATTAAPVLHGTGGFPFYDKAALRWVPAPAQQALPDGSAYAYATTPFQTNLTKAYIVTVASGGVRSFNVPAPDLPYVADFGSAGVYLATGSALGGPGTGVWLLDPGTGAIKLLRDVPRLWAIRGGYAWAARFDTRDKTVWGPSELAPANSLVRIDLATGAEVVWFYQAGTYPWFAGLDGFDRPIVVLGVNGLTEMRLIDRPGTAGQLIYTGDQALEFVQGDGDRLWIGSTRGIYLYRQQQGLQKVFAFEAGPTTAASIQPGGFCR